MAESPVVAFGWKIGTWELPKMLKFHMEKLKRCGFTTGTFFGLFHLPSGKHLHNELENHHAIHE
jgi:hypothetical protein